MEFKIKIDEKKILNKTITFFENDWVQIVIMLLLIVAMTHSMYNVKIIKTEIPETVYKNQKNIYVLDSGHGYSKKNKCRHKAFYVESGDSCFYEYKFNVSVVKKIEKKLKDKGIFYVLTDSLYQERDLNVNDRAYMVNQIYEATNEKNITPVLFSIHANASTKNLNAKGIEIFTNTKKMNKMFKNHAEAILNQIQLMNLLAENIKFELPDQVFREGKNRVFKYSNEVSEGGVRILDVTKSYSILIEAGFYTNDEDRILLSSDEYQNKIANAVFKTICTLEGIDPKIY